MKPYTYLLINASCILIPFLFSFYKKRAFYKDWKFFFPANISVAFVFLVWDELFTQMGVWGFNPDYLIGLYIYNLPLEEILFFICIPYACTFLYFAMLYLLKKEPFKNSHRQLSIILIIALSILSIINWDKLYTSITFSSTAFVLLILLTNKTKMSYIYFSYFCIVPFFLASNGILTGSLVDEPIVWYNNKENLGIRFITIPIEDFIYGFLLISLNIIFYEALKRKFRLPN